MTISDEELYNDIWNTELELDALFNIQVGFEVLSKLPENDGINASTFHFLHCKYLDLEKECAKLLQKMKNLAKERNLNYDNWKHER
jgi:hypothetical protein